MGGEIRKSHPCCALSYALKNVEWVWKKLDSIDFSRNSLLVVKLNLLVAFDF